jgi:hypothetical protein
MCEMSTYHGKAGFGRISQLLIKISLVLRVMNFLSGIRRWCRENKSPRKCTEGLLGMVKEHDSAHRGPEGGPSEAAYK